MDTLGIFEKQVSGVALLGHGIRHDPSQLHLSHAARGHKLLRWVLGRDRGRLQLGVRLRQGDKRPRPVQRLGSRPECDIGMGDVSASLLDSWNPTVLRMNRFESPGMFGIDLDDQATNYYQEKNLVIGAGYKVQAERYNTYINGILVTSEGNGDVQFHILQSNSHNYGARNIVFAKQSCAYQVYSLSDAQNAPSYLAQWDSNDVYTSAPPATISGWNNCGGVQETWAQWTGSGLDKHSTTSNPVFVDTQKVFRADYLPRGDFNPSSTSAIVTQLKFQTFAMDSFGVIGQAGPNTAVLPNPLVVKNNRINNDKVIVNYTDGRLIVSNDGDYRVTITTALGRTVMVFKGKGRSAYSLNARTIRSGVYFASVRAKNGLTTQRFIVD